MIKKTEDNINRFKRKIVFAPNGFGKTQFSLYLEETLKARGKNVALFTSRRIKDLVQVNENDLFFGESAKESNGKKILIKELENSGTIDKFVKKSYSSYSDFKDNSFCANYFIKRNVNKTDAFVSILTNNLDYSKPTNLNYKYFELDKMLDNNLFKKVSKACKNLTKYVSDYLADNVVSEEIKKAFEQAKSYAIMKKDVFCPLCGSEFSSFKELMTSITRKTDFLITNQDKNISIEIDELANEIRTLLQTRKEFSQFNSQDIKLENFNSPEIVAYYFDLCNGVINSFLFDLYSTNFGGATLFEFAKEIENLDARIEFVKKDYKNNMQLFSYIQTSVHDIILFRSNIEVMIDSKDLSLYLTLNGEKVDSLYDFLSESEIKRIALIILSAMIKFNKYDVLILDDPIDSYDDYFLHVACDYIEKIVCSCDSSVDWYLFTNDTRCLIEMSKLLKTHSIIFNDNPDLLFCNPRELFSAFELSCEQVEIINCNELLLMAKYLDPSLKISKLPRTAFSDDLLPFLSFIVTLRNFRDVVNNNYGLVKFYGNYSLDVSELIEHQFMHYDPLPIKGKKKSTDLVNSQIFDIYNKLLFVKNSNVLNFYNSSNTTVYDRRACLHIPSYKRKGNKFLNLILFKILAMSEIRFMIEQKLIDTLKDIYTIPVNKIVKAHGLNRKFEEAMKAATSNKKALQFVQFGYDIFDRHRTTINDFDHALSLMFPPYLSVSIIDMKKLKDEIEDWK